MIGRRRLIELAAGGSAALLLGPRLAMAGAAAPDHRPHVEVPILAENPAAVPVRLSVEHPMDLAHHIRSIELVLDGDPLPDKGTFRFTPLAGAARVAFPMRSGRGGLLRATAECSRHGRSVTPRALRVAGDGCAETHGAPTRERAGNPRLRVPPPARPGETVEVLARLEHDSDTGLVLRAGRHVRERPEYFVKSMRVFLDGEPVVDFRFSAALSPNPVIGFPVRIARTGTLRIVFVDSEGQRWEAAERVVASAGGSS